MYQNGMDKLRSDNVKLYEKIRFLQSYPAKVGSHMVVVVVVDVVGGVVVVVGWMLNSLLAVTGKLLFIIENLPCVFWFM